VLQLGLLLQPGDGLGLVLELEVQLPLLLGEQFVVVAGVCELGLEAGLLAEADVELGLELLDLQSQQLDRVTQCLDLLVAVAGVGLLDVDVGTLVLADQ